MIKIIYKLIRTIKIITHLILKMDQSEFEIEVSLENKPAARDPVAETIKRDLLAKKGYDQVSKVRSGQYLRIVLLASSEEDA